MKQIKYLAFGTIEGFVWVPDDATADQVDTAIYQDIKPFIRTQVEWWVSK